jgi:FdhD protein
MTIGRYNGLAYNTGKYSEVDDILAVEEALNISVNNIPFTITMRTPGSEADLVRGLLFSEFVFRTRTSFPDLEIVSTNGSGYITSVNVSIPSESLLKDFAGTRNVISVSSCGMCGKTAFEEQQMPATVENDVMLDPSLVSVMFEKVSERQKTFIQSGGTHAAGAFTIDGELLSVQEDIGRHNAVDKVIGFLLNNNLLEKAKCITVSGRVSYEIVSKALSAGIPFVAAVSAPSSMAVEFAEKSGITLMAFCRSSRLTVYSNNSHLIRSKEIVT